MRTRLARSGPVYGCGDGLVLGFIRGYSADDGQSIRKISRLTRNFSLSPGDSGYIALFGRRMQTFVASTARVNSILNFLRAARSFALVAIVLVLAASEKARAQASLTTPSTPAMPPLPAAWAMKRVTLPEALDFARAHQPAIRAALARIEERKANAGIPRAQWYPQVGLTAQILEGTTNNTTAAYIAGTSTLDITASVAPLRGTHRARSGGQRRPRSRARARARRFSTLVGSRRRQRR